MRLARREVLEQLVRLGIRDFSSLKAACRDFEVYWEQLLGRNDALERTESA